MKYEKRVRKKTSFLSHLESDVGIGRFEVVLKNLFNHRYTFLLDRKNSICFFITSET
jgi:hypothetical protein